jgi:peptidylprolyl isomerase
MATVTAAAKVVLRRPFLVVGRSSTPWAVDKVSSVRYMSTGTRGARGHGWLNKYRAGLGGRHLQGRYPKDYVEQRLKWNQEVFDLQSSPQLAYLDLTVASDDADAEVVSQRIVMELATTALPLSCQNFQALLQDKDGHGYEGTSVHKLEQVTGVCLGDVTGQGGDGGRCHFSVDPRGSFEHEAHLLSHVQPGMVTYTSAGRDQNDSRFLITTKEAPQLDGRFTAFGRVTDGMDALQDIMTHVFTRRGRPSVDIRITSCGLL